jgi:hypothetical protein
MNRADWLYPKSRTISSGSNEIVNSSDCGFVRISNQIKEGGRCRQSVKAARRLKRKGGL